MKKSKKRKILIVCLFIILIPIFLAICFTDNKTIDYTYYDIGKNTEKEQIKIMQLSDMHFPNIKIDLENVLNKIDEEKIDIITITGDLINGNDDLEESGVKSFIESINKCSNVFYVFGNHEESSNKKEELRNLLIKNNVTVLENEYKLINIKNKNILIMGLKDDGDFSSLSLDNIDSDYNILLSHRPEKFESYINNESKYIPNLILSGHAHGGQIRIFNQGLIAPNQGFFPKYTSGIYTMNYSCMVVSRGIGASILPYRINNKPHIPLINIYI